MWIHSNRTKYRISSLDNVRDIYQTIFSYFWYYLNTIHHIDHQIHIKRNISFNLFSFYICFIWIIQKAQQSYSLRPQFISNDGFQALFFLEKMLFSAWTDSVSSDLRLLTYTQMVLYMNVILPLFGYLYPNLDEKHALFHVSKVLE